MQVWSHHAKLTKISASFRFHVEKAAERLFFISSLVVYTPPPVYMTHVGRPYLRGWRVSMAYHTMPYPTIPYHTMA